VGLAFVVVSRPLCGGGGCAILWGFLSRFWWNHQRDTALLVWHPGGCFIVGRVALVPFSLQKRFCPTQSTRCQHHTPFFVTLVCFGWGGSRLVGPLGGVVGGSIPTVESGSRRGVRV